VACTGSDDVRATFKTTGGVDRLTLGPWSEREARWGYCSVASIDMSAEIMIKRGNHSDFADWRIVFPVVSDNMI
jgi:hypothetical protein